MIPVPLEFPQAYAQLLALPKAPEVLFQHKKIPSGTSFAGGDMFYAVIIILLKSINASMPREIFDAVQGVGATRSSATWGSVARLPPVAAISRAEEACETSDASGSAAARQLSKLGTRRRSSAQKDPWHRGIKVLK